MFKDKEIYPEEFKRKLVENGRYNIKELKRKLEVMRYKCYKHIEKYEKKRSKISKLQFI